MESVIAHRELRNRSGEILRAVEAGETYTVTNRGKPIARLSPIRSDETDLPLYRSARVQGGFTQLRRHRINTSSEQSIEDLRSER